jgi:hypothetical protein
MADDQGTMEVAIGGKPFTVQYIQSKALKWKYISVIPTGYIVKSVNQIRNVKFTLINGIIDYVYKENQALQDNFEKSRSMLQDKYIYDIINGRIGAEFESAGLDIGVELPYDNYQVIIYEIGEETPSNLKKYKKPYDEDKMKLDEIAAQTLGQRCKCFFLEKDERPVGSFQEFQTPQTVTPCNKMSPSKPSGLLGLLLVDPQFFSL